MSDNPKKPCPFCATTIFTSKLGDHILANHESEIFQTPVMKKKLINKEYCCNPIPVTLNNSVYHLCLCCSKVVSNIKFAKKHFENSSCLNATKEKLQVLATKYPVQDTKVIDLSGAIIGNNNTIVQISYSDANAATIKELLESIIRIGNVNRNLSYSQELKLAKAKQRGIISEKQFEEIDDLSDDSDEELVYKPEKIQDVKHVRRLLSKIPLLDPTN
jgi:hypothetical protein